MKSFITPAEVSQERIKRVEQQIERSFYEYQQTLIYERPMDDGRWRVGLSGLGFYTDEEKQAIKDGIEQKFIESGWEFERQPLLTPEPRRECPRRIRRQILMLRINATQVTARGDSYLDGDEIVGYFPVDETRPPYTPQKVELVTEGELWREPSTRWAWVAHDGDGNVDGFGIESYWAEEGKNPGAYFFPPDDYQFLPPDDCDCIVPI